MQQSSMDATALYDHSGHCVPGGNDVADATMARWLQSVGLQHQASTGVDHRGISNLMTQQGCAEQSTEEKQRLVRQMRNLNMNCQPDYEAFTSTPQYSGGYSASGRYYSPEISADFGAGLLDLHSMDDSELLSEHVIHEPFEPSPFIASATKAFDKKVNVLDNQQKKGECGSEFPSRFLQNDREYSSKDNNIAKIKVIVRKRPLNKKEIARRDEDIVDVHEDSHLTVHEPKLKVDLTAYVEKHDFCFDAVLNEHVTNDEVYRVTVEPIIPTIFQGVKATCFAYGQTGSGKTYTMKPLPLRASEDLVRLLHHPMYQNQRYKLWLSYFEIYGGKLYDLLSDRKKLTMREDGRQQVCIVGLQEYEVYDVRVVKQFIEIGNAARSTGYTGANEESSRSHAILQLVLKTHQEIKEFRRSNNSTESKSSKIVGKISFIDLAGNERGADTTDNDRQTRIEGAEINKSLLALKECIRALDNDRIHIPFRGSKLTEVLRDSFVGNSKTVMISCISPNSSSCEHTLNTLRYADRVKSLSRTGNTKKEQGPTVLPPGPGKLRPALSSAVGAENVYNQHPETKYFDTSKRVVEKELSPYDISIDTLPPRRAPNHSYHGREESPEPSTLEKDNFDSRSISGDPWNQKVSSTKLSRIIDTEEVREVSPPPQVAYENESSFGACRTYKMSSEQLPQNTDTREEMRNASPSRQRAYKNEPIVGSSMTYKKQLPQNTDIEEVQKLPPLRLRAYEDKRPDKHSQNAYKMYPTQHCQSTNPEEVFEVSPPRGRGQEDETAFDGSRTYQMSTKQNYQITDARETLKVSPSLQRPYGSDWHDKQEVWSSKQITLTSGLSAASNKNQHGGHSSANYTKHEPGTPCFGDRTNELQEKEVETLVSAHRKEIEESMEIVRDEMKLLAEVDQPGSLIDNYVAEMSFILSRRAASLASLQARLARFQHRLREEDIQNRKRTHYQ